MPNHILDVINTSLKRAGFDGTLIKADQLETAYRQITKRLQERFNSKPTTRTSAHSGDFIEAMISDNDPQRCAQGIRLRNFRDTLPQHRTEQANHDLLADVKYILGILTGRYDADVKRIIDQGLTPQYWCAALESSAARYRLHHHRGAVELAARTHARFTNDSQEQLLASPPLSWGSGYNGRERLAVWLSRPATERLNVPGKRLSLTYFQ